MNILNQTDMLMTAHICYPQIEKDNYISKLTNQAITLPATFSKSFLTNLLRNELKYKGLIISDSMVMDAIDKHFERMDSAKLAINAGIDIFLMPLDLRTPQNLSDFEDYIRQIAAMVNDGRISIKKIDESVKRILNLKYNYGLLPSYNEENSQPTESTNQETDELQIGTKEHHQKEWEIALKSITLLRNDEKTLPIKFSESDKKKILVTVNYQGQVNSVNYAVNKLKKEKLISQDSVIDAVYIDSPASEKTSKYIEENDVIIAVMATYGLEDINPYKKDGEYSGFLDRLLEEAHKADKKFVLISAQLPYDTARFPASDAILACYNARVMEEDPGDFSKECLQYGPSIPASIYTIFGGSCPSGKLPVNVPVLSPDYEYTDEILFQNGSGIGY